MKRGNITRKVFALLLTLAMVMTYMPVMAFAGTENPPEGAVAYVTNANGAVDAGEEGADGENDLGGGFYKTLQAAIDACPNDEETTITMVDDELYGSNKGANIISGKNIIP